MNNMNNMKGSGTNPPGNMSPNNVTPNGMTNGPANMSANGPGYIPPNNLGPNGPSGNMPNMPPNRPGNMSPNRTSNNTNPNGPSNNMNPNGPSGNMAPNGPSGNMNPNGPGNMPPNRPGNMAPNGPSNNMNPNGPGNMTMGPYGYPNPYMKKQETPVQKQRRAYYYEKMSLPTLIYALLYALFLFDNHSGITMPLFAISTLAYIFYGIKVTNTPFKKSTYIYGAIMILLGISSCLTSNATLIFWNNFGIILLTIYILVHNFCQSDNWLFSTHVIAFFQALFGTFASTEDLFKDISCRKQFSQKKNGMRTLYIFIGLAISVPVLAILVGLLYDADVVFAQVVDNVFKAFNFYTLFRVFIMIIFGFWAAYCCLRYVSKGSISRKNKETKTFEPIVAITVLASISFVYIVFCLIQIFGVFLGQMSLPENYTYARYVHEGFAQLAVVSILNIIIVLLVLALFKGHKALTVLLTIISGCTYIMIASSLYKVILYIGAYHLSVRRIYVIWTLVVAAIILGGVITLIFKPNFNLFKYGFITIFVCYLCLSFGKPDYWVAKYNLSIEESDSVITTDYSYISSLSTDAAPAFAGCDDHWTKEYIHHIKDDLNIGIRSFNFSRWNAKRLFKEQLEQSKSEVYLYICSKEFEGDDNLGENQTVEKSSYFTKLSDGTYTPLNSFTGINLSYKYYKSSDYDQYKNDDVSTFANVKMTADIQKDSDGNEIIVGYYATIPMPDEEIDLPFLKLNFCIQDKLNQTFNISQSIYDAKNNSYTQYKLSTNDDPANPDESDSTIFSLSHSNR